MALSRKKNIKDKINQKRREVGELDKWRRKKQKRSSKMNTKRLKLDHGMYEVVGKRKTN